MHASCQTIHDATCTFLPSCILHKSFVEYGDRISFNILFIHHLILPTCKVGLINHLNAHSGENCPFVQFIWLAAIFFSLLENVSLWRILGIDKWQNRLNLGMDRWQKRVKSRMCYIVLGSTVFGRVRPAK